jgi:hypothetical protein
MLRFCYLYRKCSPCTISETNYRLTGFLIVSTGLDVLYSWMMQFGTRVFKEHAAFIFRVGQ